MLTPPKILREVTLADWEAVGSDWKCLPYLISFGGKKLPASWASALTGKNAALLESGPTGNITLLIPEADVTWTFHADGRCQIASAHGSTETSTDPLTWLDEWSSTHRAPHLEGWPDFQGGLVAALGYELVSTFEPIPNSRQTELPLAIYLQAREALWYDASTGSLTAVVLVDATAPRANAYEAAQRRALRLVQLWDHATTQPSPLLKPAGEPSAVLNASLPPEAFTAAASRAQNYIAAGDTYQVNLSTRLELPRPTSGLMAYESVRATNPSPYMGYVCTPQLELICGSPELLIELQGERLATRPIAGTRPRTGQTDEDSVFARELAADSKERAEHLMLVDLLRNDIGRVASPGSVRVPEFMVIERYSHVMHLVSQIEGTLAHPRPSLSTLVKALFPGGTITGAPKVRTMQIIAELEPTPRGFYTGSLGWFSATGNFCLNIIIRSLTLTRDHCYAQAGAGVVADSIPGREYEESLRKALALRVALARVATL